MLFTANGGYVQGILLIPGYLKSYQRFSNNHSVRDVEGHIDLIFFWISSHPTTHPNKTFEEVELVDEDGTTSN